MDFVLKWRGCKIAHVCHCNKIDFVLLRLISDNAQSKDGVIDTKNSSILLQIHHQIL